MTANQPWIEHGHPSLIHDAPYGVDNIPKPLEGRINRDGAEVKLLEGEYTETMGWAKIVRDKKHPLIIDGQGKTVFKAGLSVMDCHNMIFQNLTVIGWAEINDSYPEIGVDGIAFINCRFLDSTSRNFFMGGHNIKNIRLEKCDFLYNLNGTHNCYLSGGHWDPAYPPVENVEIINCRFGFTPMGRNNLQFNGRFRNVVIRDCRFAHAQLNCITLIGVQTAVVQNNVGYGCNRGTGLVIYDYASHWAPYFNWFETKEDVKKFLATHWPNQNIKCWNNTWVVGPKQFSCDAYHHDDPKEDHPAVLINNAVHSGFKFYHDGEWVEKQFEFPNKHFRFVWDIYVTPSDHIFDLYHTHEADQTEIVQCVGWGMGLEIPSFASGIIPKTVSMCKYADPHFRGWPVYGYVNLEEYPECKTDFAWWHEFSTSFFNPYGRLTEKGYGWQPHV